MIQNMPHMTVMKILQLAVTGVQYITQFTATDAYDLQHGAANV